MLICDKNKEIELYGILLGKTVNDEFNNYLQPELFTRIHKVILFIFSVYYYDTIS